MTEFTNLVRHLYDLARGLVIIQDPQISLDALARAGYLKVEVERAQNFYFQVREFILVHLLLFSLRNEGQHLEKTWSDRLLKFGSDQQRGNREGYDFCPREILVPDCK